MYVAAGGDGVRHQRWGERRRSTLVYVEPEPRLGPGASIRTFQADARVTFELDVASRTFGFPFADLRCGRAAEHVTAKMQPSGVRREQATGPSVRLNTQEATENTSDAIVHDY